MNSPKRMKVLLALLSKQWKTKGWLPWVIFTNFSCIEPNESRLFQMKAAQFLLFYIRQPFGKVNISWEKRAYLMRKYRSTSNAILFLSQLRIPSSKVGAYIEIKAIIKNAYFSLHLLWSSLFSRSTSLLNLGPFLKAVKILCCINF